MARGTHANPTTLSGNAGGNSGAPSSSSANAPASHQQQSGAQSATTAPTDASAHAGFVNLGNTCFLNSVLQATSATRSLRELYQPELLEEVAKSSSSSLPLEGIISGKNTSSEGEVGVTEGQVLLQQQEDLLSANAATGLALERSRSPVLALADEEHGRAWPLSASASVASSRRASIEPQQQQSLRASAAALVTQEKPADEAVAYQPSSSDLPLNTAFRQVLERSWDTGASFKAPSPSTKRKTTPINPKRLLDIMSSKYDQYGEYRQQDGHELLRHLLDSLRMEELDVIKRMQPPPEKTVKKRRKKVKRQGPSLSAAQGPTLLEEGADRSKELVPFVDNLFCGKLLSCVVCEGCRHVSHTYEDFYDISLPLRGEPAEVALRSARKRDRIRSMADRWRKATGGTRSATGNRAATTSEALAAGILSDTSASGAMSETEDHHEAQTLKVKSLSRGRSISRPKSAGASIDMSGTAKDDLKKALKNVPYSLDEERDGAATPMADDIDLHNLSLDDVAEGRKPRHSQPHSASRERQGGGAAALLRAVSVRSRPVSRSASPMGHPDEVMPSSMSGTGGEPASPQTPKSHHRTGAKRVTKQSRQGAYLAKLLAEQPQVPSQQPMTASATAALLWGRRTQAGAAVEGTPSGSSTPLATAMSPTSSAGSHQERVSVVKAAAAPASSDHDDIETTQAKTGLVKAMNSFTAVEVLDGANSFACKRCWRRLNPPTAAERETLVRRRLRRGKAEDESEESSDDETSSGSDQEDRAKSATSKNDNRSVVEPLVLVSRPTSQASNADSMSDLGEGTTMIVDDVSTPSTAVPKIQTTSPQSPEDGSSKSDALPQSSAPKLKAPKPVLAGSNGITLGPNSLSSSGNSSDGALSTTSGDEDGGPDEEIVRVTSKPSIQFLEQDPPSRPVTAPAGAKSGTSTVSAPGIASNGLRRKRSTQSLQRRALKRFLISSTPRVLVFHFKRFQATGSGRYPGTSFKKIDDAVSFPAFLDVKPWLAPPREEYDRHGRLKPTSDPRALEKARLEEEAKHLADLGEKQSHKHHHLFGHHHTLNRHHFFGHGSKSQQQQELLDRSGVSPGPKTKYRLYAVVVHQGSMSGGHYTAYVLSDRCNLPTTPKVAPSSSSVASSSVAGGDKSSSSTSSPRARPSDDSVGDLSESSLGEPPSSEGHGESYAHSNGSSSAPRLLQQQQQQQQQQQERKPDERRWIYTSDTMVRPATLEEVLKAQAYMLFYEQM
ncbi:cysteine proteinase [Acaromyces ingoldii]|uniref:ubiquitinyl hydrolase 1 n=1 Tax=Acaromyces ingoldii TaxID=215250 RepID=A0A316YRK0_9BASI|nr:cysteine proteinase [Acaromyces ingoldii]PWN91298.1 cysteine proteinase [Acaromyces ingoldii]